MAVTAAACAGSSPATTATTTPSPVSPATAAIAVNGVAATLELTSTGAVYHVGFQVAETGGQTGAALQSIIFVYRNGYTSGSTIVPLTTAIHVSTNGVTNIAPMAVADTSGNVATEISATVSFTDDSGHKGSASGVAELPVLKFNLDGFVRDSGSGAPLANATIAVGGGPNGGASTTSDAAGFYGFTGLQAGSLSLQAQDSGYTSLTQTVALVANSESDFNLASAAPPSGTSSARRQRFAAHR